MRQPRLKCITEAISVVGTVDEIFRPIVSAVEQVLLDFGEVGYWLSWRTMFPTSALRIAQKSLGVSSREIPERIATRYDPLLAPAISILTRSVRGQVDAAEASKWAHDQLVAPRMVGAEAVPLLRLIVDAGAVGDRPLDVRGRTSRGFRAWERSFRGLNKFQMLDGSDDAQTN